MDASPLLFVCLFVCLPWQIYIHHEFPVESAYEYEYNKRHVFETLERHKGDHWFHINNMPFMYSLPLLLFMPLGAYAFFINRDVNRNLSLAFFAVILVVFLFFSVIAKTKLISYTFPVNALIWIIIAMGAYQLYEFIAQKIPRYTRFIFFGLSFFLMICSLRPWLITEYRSTDNRKRNVKIYNAAIYKTLLEDETYSLDNRVIINCKGLGDTELMFYQNVNAYHWFPTENVLDRLMAAGHQFAAFKRQTRYGLPAYVKNNDSILIINKEIK
jgi:hypothetical protein